MHFPIYLNLYEPLSKNFSNTFTDDKEIFIGAMGYCCRGELYLNSKHTKEK